jgi:lipoate-protein ligase A
MGLDVVRRLTGGRAVLHLGDLTYAVIAGTVDGLPRSVVAVYERITEGLLAAFRLLGINAEVGSESAGSPQSEVCFLNRTVGAILHHGRKFIGSAQTWYGSSMLQHGSIILEPYAELLASLYACNGVPLARIKEVLDDRMISLREILGRMSEPGEVGEVIKEGMAKVLGVDFEEGELSREEWALVRKIADQETSVVNGKVAYAGNHSKGINSGAAGGHGVGADHY